MAGRRFSNRRSGRSADKTYSSFADFVRDAASEPDRIDPVAWAGCATLAEAVELARNGWPEGWQRMKALRDAIFAKMASRALVTDILDFCARVLVMQFGKARSIDER